MDGSRVDLDNLPDADRTEEVNASRPRVTVRTHDGDSVESKLWSWDQENDLALIVVNVYLESLVEAGEGEVGDPAIAIGSPLGIEGSVTVGIISKIYADAYQTDTAINHGNSGSPLLDRDGDVLGVKLPLGWDARG